MVANERGKMGVRWADKEDGGTDDDQDGGDIDDEA